MHVKAEDSSVRGRENVNMLSPGEQLALSPASSLARSREQACLARSNRGQNIAGHSAIVLVVFVLYVMHAML